MTDFTNDASIRAAILANISCGNLVRPTIDGVVMPDLSTPDAIANRIEFRLERRHPHLIDVRFCLEQMFNEHLIMRVAPVRGPRRYMYGPNPTNAAEEAIWQNFIDRRTTEENARHEAALERTRVTRVVQSDPEEPADPSY